MATAVTGQVNTSPTASRTPAFVVNNPQGTTLDSTPNAGLALFTNVVSGNTDTGVTHSGDLGGAGPKA